MATVASLSAPTFVKCRKPTNFATLRWFLEISRGEQRECVSSSKIQLPRDNTTVVDGIRSIFLHPKEKV